MKDKLERFLSMPCSTPSDLKRLQKYIDYFNERKELYCGTPTPFRTGSRHKDWIEFLSFLLSDVKHDVDHIAELTYQFSESHFMRDLHKAAVALQSKFDLSLE